MLHYYPQFRTQEQLNSPDTEPGHDLDPDKRLQRLTTKLLRLQGTENCTRLHCSVLHFSFQHSAGHCHDLYSNTLYHRGQSKLQCILLHCSLLWPRWITHTTVCFVRAPVVQGPLQNRLYIAHYTTLHKIRVERKHTLQCSGHLGALQ